jgi:hypothetical protein
MTRELKFTKVMTACALIVALLSTSTFYAAAPAVNSAPQFGDLSAIPITGTGTVDPTNTFSGTLNITRFVNQGGTLSAVGRLVGTLAGPGGGPVDQIITIPVIPTNATCEILDLQLGPLNLDLLGLVIALDQVNLNITAEAGQGKLLGNLLCAVASLLDGGGPTGAIAGLLNNILRVLRRL